MFSAHLATVWLAGWCFVFGAVCCVQWHEFPSARVADRNNKIYNKRFVLNDARVNKGEEVGRGRGRGKGRGRRKGGGGGRGGGLEGGDKGEGRAKDRMTEGKESKE